MKYLIFCFTFLFLSMNVFSQDVASNKKYDFSEMFNLIEKEDFKFVLFSFATNENQQLISFTSQVVFPLIEEKETWKFGETKSEYQPSINLGNYYQNTPKIANFSVYIQQYQGNQGNIAKPIKGYDLCMRPIY